MKTQISLNEVEQQIGSRVFISNRGGYLHAINRNDSIIETEKSIEKATKWILEKSDMNEYFIKIDGGYDNLSITSKNSEVLVNRFYGEDNQKFNIEVSGNKFLISGVDGCLAVVNNKLTIRDCNENITEQQFVIKSSELPNISDKERTKIENLPSEFYLISDNLKVLNNQENRKEMYFDSIAEAVLFKREQSGLFYIISDLNSKNALDTESGDSVNLKNKTPKRSQLFVILPFKETKFKLIETVNGKCLTRDLDTNGFKTEDCDFKKQNQEFQITNKLPEENEPETIKENIKGIEDDDEIFYLLTSNKEEIITLYGNQIGVTNRFESYIKFKAVPTELDDKYYLKVLDGKKEYFLNEMGGETLYLDFKPLTNWEIIGNDDFITIKENDKCISKVPGTDQNILKLYACQPDYDTQKFFSTSDLKITLMADLMENKLPKNSSIEEITKDLIKKLRNVDILRHLNEDENLHKKQNSKTSNNLQHSHKFNHGHDEHYLPFDNNKNKRNPISRKEGEVKLTDRESN